MTTSTLRHLASSLMALTLLVATMQDVRAEPRTQAAASNPTAVAHVTVAPNPASPGTVAPSTAVPAAAPGTAAPGSVAAATAAPPPTVALPAGKSAANASDDSDWPSGDGPDERAESGHRGRRSGHGNDQVNFGSDSHLPAGERADSIVSIFGSSTSEGEAEDVVSILGDTRVTGPLRDSAVAVLGSTYIDSKIDGDAVAVFGNLELGPHAEVGGNVVSVGGTLHRDPAAIVHGDVENIFSGSSGNLQGLRAWVHQCLLYGRPLAFAPGLGWAWGLALFCLALYVGIAILFREGLFRCVETFEAQPGHSVLAALIAMLLTPVLVVLLCVTVIGIAAVPFVLAALLCVSLFGKAVILAWVGRRVTGKSSAGPTGNPAIAVLIGGLIVLVLYLVPVLGFVVYKVLGLLGFGAVVYTLILAARTRQADKSGGPVPGAPSPATAPNPATSASSAAAATPAAAANSPRAIYVPATFDAASTAGAAPNAIAESADQGTSSDPAEFSGPRVSAGPGVSAGSGGSGGSGGTAGPSVSASVPPAAGAPRTVTAALPRAGFLRRMAALLIDVLLIGFLMGILHHAFRAELVVLATYGAIMWKLRGSTIGGLVMDLEVVRLDGRDIDWPTAVVRALGCFLSLAVAGLGFFWIAFDAESQAWHDKIAGTVVVRVAKGTPLV